MSSKLLHTKRNAISFHFELPKKGLSLRSVVIDEDDLPELKFDAANCQHLETLTEEDVATVARVVTEGRRPEFFYKGFLRPDHPFHNSGRLYKLYSPQWMRGTSVGDLLSEADWSMKCLHVGTISNEEKTEFWAWQKTSKLDGLALHTDFPREKEDGCVLMSCESVNTEQSEKGILFVGEPKMKIDDGRKPAYSQYITEHYDSVAYHDEPLFLKMQELMKLIVAVEWMKEKGIKFNKKWLKYHTDKKKPQSQAVDVMPIEDPVEFTRNTTDTHTPRNKTDMLNLSLENVKASGDYGIVSMNAKVTKQTKTGLELTATRSCPLLALEEKMIVRATINDYDFLYGKFDHREPFTPDDDGKIVVPDVNSWSELFSETVPSPQAVWCSTNNEDKDGFPEIGAAWGGITTRSTPVNVHNVESVHKKASARETVGVKATRKIQEQPTVCSGIPRRPQDSRTPPTCVSPGTLPSRGTEVDTRNGFRANGYIDNGRATLCSDKVRVDMQTVKVASKSQVKIDGKKVTEDRKFTSIPAMLRVTSPGTGGSETHPSQLIPAVDGSTTDARDDGCFSPQDTGTSQFDFCSPTGSGDEMD